MARVLPPLRVAGETYRVLRLKGGRSGPRYLLRRHDGELFGLYAYNGQPTRLFAARLAMDVKKPHRLQGIDFFDTDGRLTVRD